MRLEFKDIELEDAQLLVKSWINVPCHTSDYSFPILWGWASEYGYQTAKDESVDFLWVRQTIPSVYNLAPIGTWDINNWEEIITTRFGKNAEFCLVPEPLVDIWKSLFPGKIDAEDDRGSWEYLYDIQALSSLSGNKYMRKRNRINQFSRMYNYTYSPITADNAADVMDFQTSWCQANDCGRTPGLKKENHCIQRILRHWNDIPNLKGGIIYVGQNIAAYTIGELANDTVIVHFEKASLEYNAGYQAINKEFLTHMLEENPSLKTVNREEDMNDAGLRESKMSYLPKGFIKKYYVTFNL